MTLLAQTQEVPLTSEYIAESVNTHPVFMRRILGMLNKAGLVTSQAGVGGGWRLRKAPEEITLLEVYRAVDENHLLSLHHRSPNPRCLIGGNIQSSLKGIFGEAERALEQVLDRRTIADVFNEVIQYAQVRTN